MHVFTIGHSNRSWEDFLALLRAHGITMVADIRMFRGSRRHPWFAEASLRASLESAGIGYLALKDLAGRRRHNPASPNTAWRNESFQAYADLMETDEFRRGVAALLELSEAQPTAMLCSEALWWRCHRMLVSDYLKAHGHEALHITDAGAPDPHPLSNTAREDLEAGGHYACQVLGLRPP